MPNSTSKTLKDNLGVDYGCGLRYGEKTKLIAAPKLLTLDGWMEPAGTIHQMSNPNSNTTNAYLNQTTVIWCLDNGASVTDFFVRY